MSSINNTGGLTGDGGECFETDIEGSVFRCVPRKFDTTSNTNAFALLLGSGRFAIYRFVEKMMDSMPADKLAEELVEVIHRTMDSERQERRKKELQRDFDTDDEALLERYNTVTCPSVFASCIVCFFFHIFPADG